MTGSFRIPRQWIPDSMDHLESGFRSKVLTLAFIRTSIADPAVKEQINYLCTIVYNVLFNV